MSTTTGKTLNLVKPELTDDHKVTIGTDLPANFQKIDDAVSAHLAETVQDSGGVHGFKVESGTFTPYIYGSTTAGTNTYSIQKGFYTKQGSLAHCIIYITMSAKDAAMAGDARIGGLPFTIKHTIDKYPVGNMGYWNNIDLSTGYTYLGVEGLPGSTYLILPQSGDNIAVSFIPASQLSANTGLIISIIYEV